MTLHFKQRHMEMIRNGEKTETRRVWDENYPRPNEGAVHIAAPQRYVSHHEADCYVEIVDVSKERLGDIDEESLEAEGGYTLQEFQDIWRELNGEWDPEQIVDVVTFEYVGRSRQEAKQRVAQRRVEG